MTDPVTAASPAAEELKPVDDGVATAVVTSDVKPDAAESSPAVTGEKPSLFDAVKASLNKDDKGTPPVSEAKPDSKVPAAEEEPAGEETDADDKGQISEEEKKLLSERTQRRIQNLARQRDDLKEPAERTRQLDNFLQSNGIPSEDAKGAFEILALMRTDPAEALKRLRSTAYELSLSLGETLPADIQERVTSGAIDEKTGRELAIARVQVGGLKQAAETLTAENRDKNEREFKSQVSKDVSAWETMQASRDPDFAKKQPLVETEFRALLQTGESIKSPADAVRLMKLAYKNANTKISSFRPAVRTEVRPPPASEVAATTGAPKTHDEAVRRALGAAA